MVHFHVAVLRYVIVIDSDNGMKNRSKSFRNKKCNLKQHYALLNIKTNTDLPTFHLRYIMHFEIVLFTRI